METSPDTVANPGEKPSTFVSRRWRRRGWLLLIALVMVIQVGSLVRGALGVRAVIYNDGPAALEDAVLECAGQRVVIGGVEAEESRYEWFRPEERTVVAGLTWTAAGEAHEGAWAVGRGERLTLRVRSDGEVIASREKSLGRTLLDAVEGD